MQGAREAEAVPHPDGLSPGTVIFVGHARLPHSMGLVNSTSVVSVEIEVDLVTRRVLHVTASGVLPRAGALLRQLLEGGDFDSRIDAVQEDLRRRYLGPCQRAMCCAVAGAHEAYLRYSRPDAMPQPSQLHQ